MHIITVKECQTLASHLKAYVKHIFINGYADVTIDARDGSVHVWGEVDANRVNEWSAICRANNQAAVLDAYGWDNNGDVTSYNVSLWFVLDEIVPPII